MTYEELIAKFPYLKNTLSKSSAEAIDAAVKKINEGIAQSTETASAEAIAGAEATAPEAVKVAAKSKLLQKALAGGKLAAKAAPWLMALDYAKAATHPVGSDLIPDYATSPVERAGMQLFEGKDNPELSNLANKAIYVGATPLRTGHTLAKSAWDSLLEAADWAGTKTGDMPKAEAPQNKGPDFIAQLDAALRQPQSEGTLPSTQAFDVGQGIASIPQPPTMPSPVGVDVSEAKKWMEEAKPKGVGEEELTSQKEGAFMSGLAGALGNINSNMSVADILLQAGAGVMAGTGKAKEVVAQAEKENRVANQRYAELMAGNTLDMARLKADDQNRVLDVAYKNALLQHDYAIKELELRQPKFLGMQQGMAVYQTTDPNGNVQVKSYDMGLLQKQAMAKALGRQLTGGDSLVADAMAGSAAPANSAMGYMGMVAAQLVNAGAAQAVFGDEGYEKIRASVMEEANVYPGSEDQRGKLYKSQLVGRLAGELMNNPSLLLQASVYSPYAAALVKR